MILLGTTGKHKSCCRLLYRYNQDCTELDQGRYALHEAGKCLAVQHEGRRGVGEGEDVKDAFYFSHDSNARNDPKITAMMSRYGYEGYGWYWAFIETLRDQPNYKYPVNKYALDALALLWHCDRIAAEQYVSDCCHEFTANGSALMCIDDCFLWSESLTRRMNVVDDKRAKAKESASYRWPHNERNANAQRTQSDGNAKRVKKSKNIDVENFFETIWPLYPLSVGKGKVSDKAKSELFSIGYEPIQEAISKYKKFQKDPKFYQHGSTFFNGGYKDFLPTPEPEYKKPVYIDIPYVEPPQESIDDEELPF